MTVILGGGIGGLSAAHYLIKAGKNNVTLLESSARIGGWIQSIRDPKTGVLFEKGPRTLRIKGNVGGNTLALVEELGLENKVSPITWNHPSAKNRLIFVNNTLHYLPSSFSALFKKTPPFSKSLVSGLWRDLTSPAKKSEDDSVYSFVERRFGGEVADYLVSSMICGICAGDAKEISVKFLMPSLFQAEQKHGSVLKGYLRDAFDKMRNGKLIVNKPVEANCKLSHKAKSERWSVFGIDGGMSSLPQTINDEIVRKGVDVRLKSHVTSISLKQDGVKCCINGKDYIESEYLISALPASTLAPLLKDEHSILSEELSKIPFVDVAVVNLAFQGKVLDKEAFGFLVPPSQGLPILGVIFDSCNFPQDGHTVLTVMMGGKWFNRYFGDEPSEKHLFNIAVGHCRDILGVVENPVCHHTEILRNCIPQYVVGHHDRIDRINSYIQQKKLPLALAGSSFNGIGIHDVILSGKRAAENSLNTN